MGTNPVAVPVDAHDSAGERYAHALVDLTRRVWHPDCTLDDALAVICRTAAEVLHVERVNIWRYDRDAGALVCRHAYSRDDDRHALPEELETLAIEGGYAASMEEVRAIDADDVESAPVTSDAGEALKAYLHHHRIRSLLDAPVRVEGELLGIICHEHIDWPRQWSSEESAFAGSMGDYVAMAFEIARRREAEKQVRHLRLHDMGTGLPNRDYMVELIQQQLATTPAPECRIALLHLKVDTNHGAALSTGVPTAEEVMAAIALRLRRLAGPDMALARVRADAFALLIRDAPADGLAVRLAERCLAAVQDLPREHADIDPVATLGIAFSDPDDADARILLRKAEQAAEQARGRGTGQYEIFDVARHETLIARLRQERTLRDALDGAQFEVHYQPERDLVENRWCGAEALVRLRAEGRLLCAAEFIEVAEASGLIVPLGRWVLEQACRAAARWPSDATCPTQVRVNVSARQFDEGDLADMVGNALTRTGLSPSRLCLEITETTLMRDIDRTLATLHRLKALGVSIAIDDFGTGYSSLVYLKRFPVDTLKIDRSFVQDLPEDRQDTAIVSAVVQLAQALGLEVVAEGVEQPGQRDALRAIGVRRMQGWLFSAAVPEDAVVALLSQPAG